MTIHVPTQTIHVDGIAVSHAIALPAQAIHDRPILLLHGWGASSALMWTAAQQLANQGWKAYTLDLPGFGATPAPSSAWSVFDYANFVLHFMDALELDCVHLIGHSFGGRLGLILGSQHADRFDKIALSDAAGIPPKHDPVTSARLSIYKAIRDGLTKVGARGLSNKLREWYAKQYGSADYQAVSGVMRETFVKVVNENLLPLAANVSRPTLLFWGDQDEDTPLWMGKTLEKTIPDAGLIVFEGAGHYAYLERLGDFIRIVDHFFKG